MKNPIRLELVFPKTEIKEIKDLLKEHPEIILDKENKILSSTEIELLLTGNQLLLKLSIFIPTGLLAYYSFRTLVKNYYKGKLGKEVEVNTSDGRHIRIKGYTRKESEKMLKKILEETEVKEDTTTD